MSRAHRGRLSLPLKNRNTLNIPNMINVLEHHGMLEVGLPSLQVMHASIGETAHFQGCTAVSETQLFGQPRKVSADWRDIPPKLMALPRLVGTKVRGKSNQHTLVVDNSTPKINEDSIAFAQPYLNPLLIIGVQPPFGKTRWCGSGAKLSEVTVVCCPRQ